MFPEEALETAISRFQSPKIAGINLKAFVAGVELEEA